MLDPCLGAVGDPFHNVGHVDAYALLADDIFAAVAGCYSFAAPSSAQGLRNTLKSSLARRPFLGRRRRRRRRPSTEPMRRHSLSQPAMAIYARLRVLKVCSPIFVPH